MKVVVGFGKTGLSCLHYLHGLGEEVVAMDSRDNPPNLDYIKAHYPGMRVVTGGLAEDILLQASQIVVSPGLSLKTPELARAIAHGVHCVGDIELFAQQAQAPIIAITGSNGKTTLTTLVGQMIKDAGLQAKVCGNIGTPVLDLLDQAVPDFYVMELSSFQLETTHSLKAKVAVLLNVTPDHMDRYAGMDDYAAAKLRIYNHCEFAVLNASEPYCCQVNAAKKTVFGIAEAKGVDLYLKESATGLFIYSHDTPCFPVADLACQGMHNVENALAAIAIGQYLGISMTSMRNTLHCFSGLAHRCQKIASSDGVDWYNDSKATNLGATVAALNSLKPLYKDIVLIAGGDAKGADLSALGPLAGNAASHVILMGAAAADLEKIMQPHVAITRVTDLQQAVAAAACHAVSGAAVLLSPACASWDMFANYEERGNLFVAAVKEFIDARPSHT